QGLLHGWLFKERSMAGVLSRGVEYSSIGARPLVNVYSPKQTEEMLTTAGFTGVSSRVRHFNGGDTPITYALRFLPPLKNPRVLDRIGRNVGWYVIVRGIKPSA